MYFKKGRLETNASFPNNRFLFLRVETARRGSRP